MALEFDVKGFLDALGSRAEVAKFCGVARTAPYGWQRRGLINSVTMAKLVEFGRTHRRGIDVNRFFVRRETQEAKKNGRG